MTEYFGHSVHISIRGDSELYRKMEEISEEMGLSMESVANLLVRVGLEIHMENNADNVLKLDK